MLLLVRWWYLRNLERQRCYECFGIIKNNTAGIAGGGVATDQFVGVGGQKGSYSKVGAPTV